jgi:tetratricopeptide (TPR) repeat protein
VEEAEAAVWDQSWLDRLAPDQDNLRAAMRWLIESRAVDAAVRLGGCLWPMWVRGGFLTEGRAHLRALLAMPGPSGLTPDWASLITADGLVAYFSGDYAAARARYEEAVAIRQMLGDQHGLALVLNYLGHAAREEGKYAEAGTWLKRSLGLSEELGDRMLSCKTLDCLGTIAQALGDYDLARLRYEQSLTLARQLDNRYEHAWTLHNLGCLALDQGDLALARAYLTESLTLRDEQNRSGIVEVLAEFSALAAAEGHPMAALRLAGATARVTQQTGIPVQHSERLRFDRWLATARRAVSEEAAAAAWAEGHDWRLDQAVAYALAPGRV